MNRNFREKTTSEFLQNISIDKENIYSNCTPQYYELDEEKGQQVKPGLW